ncbi:hypothetical protein M413DRAFT_29651 [Hebeloma cylindrosporum]|uniref:Protein kinase domain-containing protein n=1 Tax=Hebeloma cylindrosporum TaxID=76867 RepID=A0A0C2XN36_HEBCY|nr:hypothetical protein M413DRAFT_29651 [Hebeloma cylindrosporum h7]
MPNSAKSSNPTADRPFALFLHHALPLGDPAISSAIFAYQIFSMAIWTSSDHAEEDSKPSPSATSDCLRTPRLDIGEIDAIPFSQTFRDLFDGLGLHISAPSIHSFRIVGSPDVSYEIQNFTNMKDDPDWQHHEIDEIMVMSPKRLGSALPTILEDSFEVSSPFIAIPTATLSDFEFEGLPAGAGADWTTDARSCIRRDDGVKYTIKRKRMPRHYSWTEHNILETLNKFELAFIPCLRWAFYSGEHRYIVTDHCPGGTLMDLINENGPLGSHRAVFYASELVAAISGLHAAGIVHRDLHPKNILLDVHGHIVLANLEHAEFSSNTGILNLNQLEVDMLGYRAPELLLGWAHDSAVDCWSFGMVLYYMFFGSHPFGGRDGTDDIAWLHDRIIASSIPMESLRLVHPMARDLILKCLERNPAMRWSIDKISNHGYFSHVDWQKVSAKSLEVPSFEHPIMELDSINIQETHRRHMSSNPLAFNAGQQTTASIAVLRGALSAVKPLSSQNAPVLPELFMPAPKISIREVVQEEDESTSISGTAGHPREDVYEESREKAIDAAERMSRFWDDLDKEEKGSVRSDNSLEFGGPTGAPYTKAPKLRKYRSAIHSHHRLFNISTASFQAKLRRKPRSTSALRQTRQTEPIENLPFGVHQIGSGIGFTYGTPAAVPSKVSVCSFTPSCHLFHGGFSVLNRGFGLGHSARRTKGKIGDHTSPAPAPENSDPVTIETPASINPDFMPTQDVGNGTFIRDMYRTPSWILSPPDSLPSPLALVNAELSPFSGSSEPFTPATLVDEHDCGDGEVNISIPKHLEIELDFPYSHWAPDSTLRLVPASAMIGEEEKLPGGFDSANTSSYSGVVES